MKRRFSFLLAVLVFAFGVLFLGEEGTVRAAAPNGIANNGLAGININVNASPYTDFAKIPTWGQYAYGPSGCAWFASARVKQLTGKGDMIYSGPSWYNSAYSRYGFSRGSAMKAPALLCWKGHVAVLEKIDGGTAYISEGGMSGYGSNASTGYTIIRAVPTSRLTGQNANFMGYVYFSAVQQKPYYSKIGVEWVDNWNASLTGRIENPGRHKIDNVGVHIWDSAGNMVVNHKEAFGQATSYVNQGLNIVAEALPTGLRSGETYTFQMFAEFNGTSVSSSKGTFTCTDSVKPAITDVKVYDVDENGYTVSCTATDNFKVDRVQFPTWTIENGQDDLVGDWSTNSKYKGSQNGNKYTYHVNRSDHNNEYGIYRTHIYAYDKAGNSICVVADDVEVKEAAKPDNPIVNGDALVSVAQKEYDTYHGQQYNLQYGSSPWCSNFVSWCARQAGISSDVIQSTATVQVMYDSLLNGCGATVVSSPQKGDLVFYKYTNYDSERFHHVGIMTGANETIQGNVNNTWWKGKPDALDNIKQITYVRPAYNGKYVTPGAAYFSEYNLNKTEETNAEVYVKIMNPDRKSVTSVGCELYDTNGNLLKSYAENCSFATSYVNYTCNFRDDMKYELSPGTTYRFILNAVVDGQRMNDEQRTFTTKETNGGGKLELREDSPFVLTDDGILTGLTQNRNTVKEVAQAFTSQNLVFKDMSGNALAEDATLGTGATVSVMDGDTVKASCQVVLAGDVTGDGKVNGKDVSMTARSLVGKATLNDAQKSAADVQEDGAVNGKDVSKLARSLVGKSTIASQAE